LLTQPELRNQLGQQAADYARAYAWENIAARILELAQEMVRVPAGR
jgi:glycosyltransferase involved in cell wall biosynthesis